MKYNSGLSENEWFIMQVLWEKSPSTLREICDALKLKNMLDQIGE